MCPFISLPEGSFAVPQCRPHANGSNSEVVLKSGSMALSQPRLDVAKLKDEREVEEFANRLSGDFGGLGAFGEP